MKIHREIAFLCWIALFYNIKLKIFVLHLHRYIRNKLQSLVSYKSEEKSVSGIMCHCYAIVYSKRVEGLD